MLEATKERRLPTDVELDVLGSLVDFTVSYFDRIEGLLEKADRDDETTKPLVATAEDAWRIHFELDYLLDQFKEGVRTAEKADALVTSLFLNLVERDGLKRSSGPLRVQFQDRLGGILEETLAGAQVSPNA